MSATPPLSPPTAPAITLAEARAIALARLVEITRQSPSERESRLAALAILRCSEDDAAAVAPAPPPRSDQPAPRPPPAHSGSHVVSRAVREFSTALDRLAVVSATPRPAAALLASSGSPSQRENADVRAGSNGQGGRIRDS